MPKTAVSGIPQNAVFARLMAIDVFMRVKLKIFRIPILFPMLTANIVENAGNSLSFSTIHMNGSDVSSTTFSILSPIPSIPSGCSSSVVSSIFFIPPSIA